MSDKQWVVVPREPTCGMLKALTESWCEQARRGIGVWAQGSFVEDYKRMVDASPRYEPQGEAVEAAAKALYAVCDTMCHGVGDTFKTMPDYGQDRFRDQARAALTAAFPELLARIEALEKEIDGRREIIAGLREQYDAELCKLLGQINGLREQHARDSAELRALCAARDEARAERDRLAELLEALRGLVAAVDRSVLDGCGPALDRARAAIAKALGDG